MHDFIYKLKKSSFRRNIKTRTLMFSKYKTLLKNGMNYKRATKTLLKRLGGKRSSGKLFLDNILRNLDDGGEFSKSLDGWATPNEILILAAGEKAGSDVEAFAQCVNLMERLSKMSSIIKKACVYPAMLLSVLTVFIIAFALFLVPLLISLTPIDTWPDYAVLLSDFSLFFYHYFFFIVIAFALFIYGVLKSLSLVTGDFRDQILDRVPPYSIYKEIQAGLFLISLSTLLKSGVSFKKSLEFISEKSPKYITNKVQEISDSINNGVGEGKALNTDFLGEVGGDIEDYVEGASIEEVLAKIGDDVVNEKIEKIEKISKIIAGLTALIPVTYVMWGYLSFLSVVESIVM